MQNEDAIKALSDHITKLASAIEIISIRFSVVELIAMVALSDSGDFDKTLAKLEKGLGSVDISKIGVLKQILTIAKVNRNPLIQ